MAETANFNVNLGGNADQAARQAADALEQLRARIASGQDALKSMTSDLRRLRGTTDEVKGAKDQLKAKIDAERNAISASSLSLIKQGSSYEELAAKARVAAKATTEVKVKTEEKKGATDSLTGSLTSLKAGYLIVAGAVAAYVASVVSAVVAVGRFIVESANAARTAGLMREAMTGSAQQSYALGTQIDALATKVPTAKAALQGLSISLLKSKFSGQTMVNAFNAIGQASAALGDDVGTKLRGLLERGLTPLGREGFFLVNPAELQGTGLAFEDLAQSIAANMKMGIGQARVALASGRVKLADGAKALRDAVEKKFGGINLRKMLDLDVISAKFKEGLANLTKNVKLEPLLEGIKKLASLFDESTVAGSALKTLVTLVGDGMVKAFTVAGPFVAQFLKGMVIGALGVAIAFFQVKNAIKDAFANSPALQSVTEWTGKINGLKVAMLTGQVVVVGFALAIGIALASIGTAFAALAAPIVIPIVAAQKLVDGIYAAIERLKKIDVGAIAKGITDGLAAGLTAGITGVENAITGIGTAAIKKLKATLGIASPSKVFAELGAHTAAGYETGVAGGSPGVNAAVGDMVAPPSKGGGGRGAINVTVNISAGADAASTLGSDTFLAKLTKAIEDAVSGAGAPVHA